MNNQNNPLSHQIKDQVWPQNKSCHYKNKDLIPKFWSLIVPQPKKVVVVVVAVAAVVVFLVFIGVVVVVFVVIVGPSNQILTFGQNRIINSWDIVVVVVIFVVVVVIVVVVFANYVVVVIDPQT